VHLSKTILVTGAAGFVGSHTGAAVVAVLTDRVVATGFGDEGVRLARARFDMERALARVKAEYHLLLEQKGPLADASAMKTGDAISHES
jgi:nucleoside-diphosphate-sugar epimerase